MGNQYPQESEIFDATEDFRYSLSATGIYKKKISCSLFEDSRYLRYWLEYLNVSSVNFYLD